MMVNLVRQDVGGSAFTMAAELQAWVARGWWSTVVEGAESGTGGVQAGGLYRIQPLLIVSRGVLTWEDLD